MYNSEDFLHYSLPILSQHQHNISTAHDDPHGTIWARSALLASSSPAIFSPTSITLDDELDISVDLSDTSTVVNFGVDLEESITVYFGSPNNLSLKEVNAYHSTEPEEV